MPLGLWQGAEEGPNSRPLHIVNYPLIITTVNRRLWHLRNGNTASFKRVLAGDGGHLLNTREILHEFRLAVVIPLWHFMGGVKRPQSRLPTGLLQGLWLGSF